MATHQQRMTGISQLTHQKQQLIPGRRINRRTRFIEKKHSRWLHKTARKQSSLLLSSRECIKASISEICQPNPLDCSLPIATPEGLPIHRSKIHEISHADGERPINPTALRHQHHPFTASLDPIAIAKNLASTRTQLPLKHM
jgi:(p)ppGpp synthase/HD superfamily hydrolase